MPWNYRIVKRGNKDDEYLMFEEVYYNNKWEICSMTEGAGIIANDPETLRKFVEEAFAKPIIDTSALKYGKMDWELEGNCGQNKVLPVRHRGKAGRKVGAGNRSVKAGSRGSKSKG
jgi:hypothetical protein